MCLQVAQPSARAAATADSSDAVVVVAVEGGPQAAHKGKIGQPTKGK